MIASGKVYKYGDNVDTDVIIPARYLNTSKPSELALYCMMDIDDQFSKTVEKGDIIVAGQNFGCGSSREHAPIAIKASGVSCVIAKTFARIFYRNAINIGLPIMECEAAVNAIEAGDKVDINFATGEITNISKTESYKAEPFPEFIQKIIAQNGLVGYTTNEVKAQSKIIKNSKKYKIAVLPGDGIGPEVVSEAVKVLKHIGDVYKIDFEFKHALIGGAAIDHHGEALPATTLETCRISDAVLLGSVGGPKWDGLAGEKRPEKALLGLRKGLELYANIRPAIMYESLKGACPLKTEIVPNGFDICVVRELTGGIYFGERGTTIDASGVQEAFDIESYHSDEIKRIGIEAFEIAMKRNKKIVSVDKANVLESSRLWRKEMEILAQRFPEVTLEHMYVDNAAMQLIKDPSQFDVIVTSNMFGDILSDEASMLTGSIGMLPSASLGQTKLGLYEPIHGSAPDIAGLDIANPIATILSTAMMLRHSLDLQEEAKAIELAVENVLNSGYRTVDIFENGKTLLGTQEMGNQIIDAISKNRQ